MKIANDIFSFDAADFDALSDFAKTTIGPLLPDLIADLVNNYVESAKQSAIAARTREPEVAVVLRKLAAADSQKVSDALTAADAVLGSVVAPSPIK